ncbi:hypothetical protein EUX98_g8160 [Antrodiella citrinella]|uniref:Uncharacterized protein n=1 Tax=Antrodiella citrinella TaxID=2447956 RepID=A0A4S4MBC2_9APHY|nr:hypothetical protein EUX98_g8160 [Antrodiella citrinella]
MRNADVVWYADEPAVTVYSSCQRTADRDPYDYDYCELADDGGERKAACEHETSEDVVDRRGEEEAQRCEGGRQQTVVRLSFLTFFVSFHIALAWTSVVAVAVTISTAASALTSLATLSLSTSPAHGFTGEHAYDASDANEDDAASVQDAQQQPTTTELSAGGITIKNGWEHSPHWREASKLLLSKHQQVQLLEAAAILSHLSPSASGGTSLPEDRSLWPSFLSGGALPPPSIAASVSPSVPTKSLDARPAYPTSSSVPGHSVIMPPSRPLSTGPRLHDYSVPSSGNVTHVRPGIFGVPTGSELGRLAAVPVPVPISHTGYRDTTAHSVTSDPWSSPGWSLPRSSVRSVSVTSGSRSRSGSVPSKSDEGDEESEVGYAMVDVEGGEEDVYGSGGFTARGRVSATRGWSDEYEGGVVASKPREAKIEEEWDGMEMEMEM